LPRPGDDDPVLKGSRSPKRKQSRRTISIKPLFTTHATATGGRDCHARADDRTGRHASFGSEGNARNASNAAFPFESRLDEQSTVKIDVLASDNLQGNGVGYETS